MTYKPLSVREKYERGYWRRVRDALNRYCRDHAIDKLASRDAKVIRHVWHHHLQLPESHTTWDRHQFTVIYRFLETYTVQGELAALALDGPALYRQAVRDGYIWVITHRVPAGYLDSWFRNQLQLETWEQIPPLASLPSDLLARAATTATQRQRGPVAAAAVPDPKTTGETPF